MRNKRLCIKVGRETGDLRTSSMGRGEVWDGEVWDGDAGTSYMDAGDAGCE